MRIKAFLSWVILAAVVGSGLFVLFNFQAVSDYLRLRNYSPPSAIVKLADETTMKDSTRRVFYINHPQLDDKAEFNTRCRTDEKSIILGCYISNRGIYLLDVTEPKLDGVIEVTAAHETLHAEYDRLSDSEKSKVDKMTSSFFSTLKDERIKQTIENYRKNDPSVVPNELHSILGTEVKDLSPELEKYYSKYFSDRKKIVSYSANYEKSFIELENKANQIESQLSTYKSQIDANRARIDAMAVELSDKRSHLDSLLAQNKTDEYNQAVSDYNDSVSSYNSLINQTKQLINQYNELVKQYHKLALQQRELNEAIDSNSLQPKL